MYFTDLRCDNAGLLFFIFTFNSVYLYLFRSDCFMNKYEIVNELAKNKTVEKIVRRYKTPYRDDLSQYAYMWLIEKGDENMLNELYSQKKINQYISGLIYRQIHSKFSYHAQQNVKKIGEPIIKQNKDGDTYEETLVYDDTSPHQLQDEVDDYLNSLSELDKEILWAQIIPKEKRTDDIANICDRYHITNRKYIRIVPQIKENFKKHFTNFKTKNKEKGKYNSTKVEMSKYETGKVVKVFENLGECKLELVPKGFKTTSIYACLEQKQKQYLGYIFRYID